jgi:hypothetical protein
MVREAKRKDFEYKRYATAEMAKYLSAFPSINLFDPITEIVEEGLSDLDDEDDGDLQMKPMYSHFLTLLTIAVCYYEQTCTL